MADTRTDDTAGTDSTPGDTAVSGDTAVPGDTAVSGDAGGPGTLVIKERAVAKVAVAAAGAVADVVHQVGGMSRLTGRELPRADVSVGERSVSINLYVALAWPCRISDVAAAVHDEVSRVLDVIVGLPLHRLNVLVAATTPRDDDYVPKARAPEARAAESPGPDRSGPDRSGPDRSVSASTRAPRPPTASPAALPVALVLAVALMGLAFVAGREFLIVRDTIVGAPWVLNSVDWIADLRWAPWMLVASGASIVVGLVLLALGLKPRTRTHVGALSPASPASIVWLRPADVARVCSDRAGSVHGSVSATTTVTKKRVTVEVRPVAGSDTAALTESVRDALTPVLAALAERRTLQIRFDEAAS